MQPLLIDDTTIMNYLGPTVLQDGNLIGLNKNGQGQLLFYQIRKQTGNHIDKLDVVAAVSVANIDDLTNFRDALTQVIEDYKNSEK